MESFPEAEGDLFLTDILFDDIVVLKLICFKK
jgi:hypothetical protein